jgi:FkbM family methyltransferase
MNKKIIFDIGANKGQNLPYYLNKADKVIAIEANPILAELISKNYSSAILNGKLEVVNKCICLSEKEEWVTFYKHKSDDGLSRFLAPEFEPEQFVPIQVKSIHYKDMLRIFGEPYYVKMDVEGLDADIMRELLKESKVPEYVSFENCGKSIVEETIKDGRFSAYNIVAGYNLNQIYPDFDSHASGPFGDDLKSPWLNEDGIRKVMNGLTHTWVDFHFVSSKQTIGEPDFSFYKVPKDPFLGLKKLLPESLKRQLKKLLKND